MKIAGLIVSGGAAIMVLIGWIGLVNNPPPTYGHSFSPWMIVMAVGVIAILGGLLIASLQNRTSPAWRWYHSFLAFYITWGLIFLGIGLELGSPDTFWIGFGLPIGIIALGYAIKSYFS